MQRKNFPLKTLLIGLLLGITLVSAETLTSDKYQILNPSIEVGGGIAESTNYSILSSIGDPTSIAKLESTNYKLTGGVPSSFQANVPIVRCFETDSTSTDTECAINTSGLQTLCGNPGCYDRARLELDEQDNPYDTLYLVKFTDINTGEVYYLQSDHSIATTYDINDFMDQCDIEGIDIDGPDCGPGGDRENTSLQEINIYGLSPNSTYIATISALHGDFTQSEFGPEKAASTTDISIVMDIDVSDTNVETDPPYSININLTSIEATTATDSIWIDISTNFEQGVNIYSSNMNSGLLEPNTNTKIESHSEDLDNPADTDGGYGLKIAFVTQDTLGPLKTAGSIYQTTGINEVGQLSTTNSLLFYTDTDSSYGQVTGGRAQVQVKAKSALGHPAGTYIDTISFYCTTNL